MPRICRSRLQSAKHDLKESRILIRSTIAGIANHQSRIYQSTIQPEPVVARCVAPRQPRRDCFVALRLAMTVCNSRRGRRSYFHSPSKGEGTRWCCALLVNSLPPESDPANHQLPTTPPSVPSPIKGEGRRWRCAIDRCAPTGVGPRQSLITSYQSSQPPSGNRHLFDQVARQGAGACVILLQVRLQAVADDAGQYRLDVVGQHFGVAV